MLLFVTKVLVFDLYLIEKVLDVLDVFQVLWVLELVRVLANMKKYLYLTQVLWKVLDPNPEIDNRNVHMHSVSGNQKKPRLVELAAQGDVVVAPVILKV